MLSRIQFTHNIYLYKIVFYSPFFFQIPVTSTKIDEKPTFPSKKSLASNVNKSYHSTLSVDQLTRSNEKSATKKDISSFVLKLIPSSTSMDISPILNKPDKYPSKKILKNVLHNTTIKSTEGLSKKIIEFGQKPVSISSCKTLNADRSNPIDRNVISTSLLKTAKNSTSKISHSSSFNITKISNGPEDAKQGLVSKKDYFSTNPTTSSYSASNKESDDDVICID